MNWSIGLCEDGGSWYALLRNDQGGTVVSVAGFPTWQCAARYPQEWLLAHLAHSREQARLDEANKAKLMAMREGELLRALAEARPAGLAS